MLALFLSVHLRCICAECLLNVYRKTFLCIAAKQKQSYRLQLVGLSVSSMNI